MRSPRLRPLFVFRSKSLSLGSDFMFLPALPAELFTVPAFSSLFFEWQVPRDVARRLTTNHAHFEIFLNSEPL